MHINEAYEHEPLISCQMEEKCSPSSGCNKMGTQVVDVTKPMTLTPVAEAGTPIITCLGAPDVDCSTDDEGTSCLVTVTQRISVSVPIRYSVSVDPDDPTIACVNSTGEDCGCA